MFDHISVVCDTALGHHLAGEGRGGGGGRGWVGMLGSILPRKNAKNEVA